MEPVHFDEARKYLITYLANLAPIRGANALHNSRPYGCDLWVPNVVEGYYSASQPSRRLIDMGSEAEPLYLPFYDATWELCRLGIIRPAEIAPRGSGNSTFRGDGYSLTDYGISWVKVVAEEPYTPTDPSRLIEILKPFEVRFGKGFMQRAAEAVKCHRTNNYLACCVMVGGATESILLAVAVAKTGDESKVLSEYRSSKGRKAILARITRNLGKGIAEPLFMLSGMLSFWRDEASHGQSTNISEGEAHMALAQLLRLSQFATDNWPVLTTQNES